MTGRIVVTRPRAYYNDCDADAAAWLRELIKRGLIADGEVDERSILDVAADDIRGFTQCHFFAGIGGWSYALRLAGWPDDRPVWTGSPPCQPFSSAGRGLGKNDARHLSPKFAELVGACRPGLLFGEQVASAEVIGQATNGAGADFTGPPQWSWLDDLFDSLEAAQYACGASDIAAASVGAPHIRQRVFFGAIGMADRYHAGPQRHWEFGWEQVSQDRPRAKRHGAENCVAGWGNALNSHWATADWINCQDGKWRPVEPGTFPLANGIPARVGRLRGYGNAIVPQAAAEFISAFCVAAEVWL